MLLELKKYFEHGTRSPGVLVAAALGQDPRLG